jgi:hypothetical protein
VPDRRAYNPQQLFPPEGFGKEAGCALPDRLFTIRAGSLSAYEYDRDAIIGAGQLVLEFQAADSRQLNVDHQTSRVPRGSRLQKLFCRSEACNHVSRRFHTVLQRLTHERVIVDNYDVPLQSLIHLGQLAVPVEGYLTVNTGILPALWIAVYATLVEHRGQKRL